MVAMFFCLLHDHKEACGHVSKNSLNEQGLCSQNKLSVTIRTNFCPIIFALRLSFYVIFYLFIGIGRVDYDVQKCVGSKLFIIQPHKEHS